VRQKIGQPIRFGTQNQDGNAPAGKVLLVLKTLVHLKNRSKPAFSAGESRRPFFCPAKPASGTVRQ